MEPEPREKQEEEIAEAAREYARARRFNWPVFFVLLLAMFTGMLVVSQLGISANRFLSPFIIIAFAYLLLRWYRRDPGVTPPPSAMTASKLPAWYFWVSIACMAIFFGSERYASHVPPQYQPLYVAVGLTIFFLPNLWLEFSRRRAQQDRKVSGLFIGIVFVDIVTLAVAMGLFHSWIRQVDAYFISYLAFIGIVSACFIIGDVFIARRQFRQLQRLVQEAPSEGGES